MSESWSKLRVGDFCNLSAGGTPDTNNPDYWEGGDIPWMSSGEVHDQRIRRTRSHITERGLQDSSAKFFPIGSVLVALAGQGKTRGKVAISEIELTTNQSIAAIIADKGVCEPDFLFYNLDSRYEELRTLSGGSGRAGLNLSILSDVEISLPPLPEQKKIAEILSGVDKQIYALENKISKLISTKTEIFRDLFSCFDELGGNGVCKKESDTKIMPLESVCEAVIDCKNRTPPYTESGHPVVRTPNVRNGKLVRNDLKYTDISSYEIWTARSVPRPMDVLFTREAPLGEVCLVPENFKCCLGQRMMLFRADKSLIDPRYLLFSLMSPFVQDQLLKSKGGTTVGHARVADVRDLLIPIVPKEKQLRIASVFSSIETFLEGVTRKKEKLEIQKSALASDLLSGRKRVSV
ncbi:restriction endonuclease subunit S [Synechococcus sp. W2B2]|uniref:restriction endonuclease subunit S n=1 Tax=unclassified Synechococcus TaxID=2626047 RepID=UPI00006BD638|nr:restriction endonuclease subunit S [Synechococcus sp. WH 7805]EAR18286.1 type I restriction-modification system, S subunit [Synechococcus sp. WH 7805]